MHILYHADFRHNFLTLKTPQNMYPLKVVTNEKGEAVGDVLTIIC
jgi:hypothetical protein